MLDYRDRATSRGVWMPSQFVDVAGSRRHLSPDGNNCIDIFVDDYTYFVDVSNVRR